MPPPPRQNGPSKAREFTSTVGQSPASSYQASTVPAKGGIVVGHLPRVVAAHPLRRHRENNIQRPSVLSTPKKPYVTSLSRTGFVGRHTKFVSWNMRWGLARKAIGLARARTPRRLRDCCGDGPTNQNRWRRGISSVRVGGITRGIVRRLLKSAERKKHEARTTVCETRGRGNHTGRTGPCTRKRDHSQPHPKKKKGVRTRGLRPIAKRIRIRRLSGRGCERLACGEIETAWRGAYLGRPDARRTK